MSIKAAQYVGYTLAEVLVVLMIVIILGGFGFASFGGLRDTVLVKQNIENIKQDMQLVQQKAMLLEKKQGEGWIYGIGIDFTNVNNGSYSFFKWCSPFSSYGDIRTRNEILAFDPNQNIGELSAYGPNGSLPLDELDNGGLCNRDTTVPSSSYITNMPGLEDGKITAGFNINLFDSGAAYVVFEAVTGRVFLYRVDGSPVNYEGAGEYFPERVLGITIQRNQGDVMDVIQVYPLSGSVSHTTVDDPAIIEQLEGHVLEVSDEPNTTFLDDFDPTDKNIIWELPIPGDEIILPGETM